MGCKLELISRVPGFQQPEAEWTDRTTRGRGGGVGWGWSQLCFRPVVFLRENPFLTELRLSPICEMGTTGQCLQIAEGWENDDQNVLRSRWRSFFLYFVLSSTCLLPSLPISFAAATTTTLKFSAQDLLRVHKAIWHNLFHQRLWPPL